MAPVGRHRRGVGERPIRLPHERPAALGLDARPGRPGPAGTAAGPRPGATTRALGQRGRAPRRRRPAPAPAGSRCSPAWDGRGSSSRITKSWRSGSIQNDVPVKPVWPKEREERSDPADEYAGRTRAASASLVRRARGVSQPRARVEPGTAGSSREALDHRPRNDRGAVRRRRRSGASGRSGPGRARCRRGQRGGRSPRGRTRSRRGPRRAAAARARDRPPWGRFARRSVRTRPEQGVTHAQGFEAPAAGRRRRAAPPPRARGPRRAG